MSATDRRESAERLLALLGREPEALFLLSLAIVHEAREMLAKRLVDAGAGVAELREAMGYRSLGTARSAIRRVRREPGMLLARLSTE